MDSRNSANPIEQARNVFRGAGGTLRAGQARARGVHPRTLSQMVDGGQLIRISRGLYQLPEATEGDPDLTVVALKVPTGVVCLISALAIHELTTQIPHAVDVALPHGTTPPKLAHPPVHYYRFGEASMAAGVEDRDVGGTMIRVFDAAKAWRTASSSATRSAWMWRSRAADISAPAWGERRYASRYADINRARAS